jgi:hypothetical protein
MIVVILNAICLVITCLYAWVYGGNVERLGGVSIAAAAILSIPSAGFYANAETGIFFIDCALLIIFGAIAILSDRYWPLWAAGFQGVPVVTHIAKMIAPSILPKAYANYAAFWAFPVMIVLILGTRAYHSKHAKS